MFNKLERYLLEAEGKNKEELPLDNPYREIGFDKDKKRLGWLRVIPFVKIRECLEDIFAVIESKENFIFVGMGGSINGIKPLLTLFKRHSLYVLDNLDPLALEEIIKKINNIDKTLVILISKSGSTRETQLLGLTLSELFKENWQEHFLWLTDSGSFKKLDSLGWVKVKKFLIQFDGQVDTGGRFSSPSTLIFLFPLFLLLGRDFQKLKEIYQTYLSLQKEIRKRAFSLAREYGKKPAYFLPMVKEEIREVMSSWLYQIFQESLGGKRENFPAKTIISHEPGDDMFLEIKLDLQIDNPVVYLMSQMYFFQVFLAFYSAFWEINFVNQDFVEKYKSQMRELEKKEIEEMRWLNLEEIINQVRKRLKESFLFIDIIFYFHPESRVISKIKDAFSQAFTGKRIIMGIGSDWNHHSYQAAVQDKNTFYVFLLSSSYKNKLPFISGQTLKNNIATLKLIAKATHFTLKDKSLLFTLSL